MRDNVYSGRLDFENCWYRGLCDKVDTAECSEMCRKFVQTDYLFQLSDLPKSCWTPQKLSTEMLAEDVKETLCTIMADIEFYVKSGFNMYLYGETGCGKTSWAIKLMNNYFACIAERNNFSTRGLFVNIPSFLRDAKLHMTYKSENFMEKLETIKNCDIVIWDEVCQTNPTNYESQWLYSYINERLLAKKCNIYTSNLTPDALREVDERLASRVCGESDCLEITGIDMRVTKTYTAFMNSGEVV